MIRRVEINHVIALYSLISELSGKKKRELKVNEKDISMTSEIGIDIQYQIKEKGMMRLYIKTPKRDWEQVFSQEKAESMIEIAKNMLIELK